MECPRCRHHNTDAARFCAACGAPLARSCGRCAGELPAAAAFCPACGHPVLGSPPAPRFATPGSYTPRHLAEKILTSRSAIEGERKQVTVLFADLQGSMKLVADRDPEQVQTILDPILERMMEAVHRYEGTVNQVMGDGIMALFGAPIAHEDHAVRACRAALRMQESVRRQAEAMRRTHGEFPQVRIGLNSGEVVVASIGSDLRMDYTAVGPTTQLAARLEELASPGTIVISAATRRLTAGYVEVAELEPISIAGFAHPVVVYEAVGLGEARTRVQAAAPRELSRFVGREVEMGDLRRALARAGAGRGQVVAVVGEAGVGKSRLLFEITQAREARDWLVLAVGGVSYGKGTPYLPIAELLRAYFAVRPRDGHAQIRESVAASLAALDPGLRQALPALLALLDVPVEDREWQMLDPAGRRRLTQEAVKGMLLRQSLARPLLLMVEDLHWIDSESQALLDSLVVSLPTARMLLLVNYRPEYGHEWGGRSYYTQLRIDPLPATGAAELLAGLLGRDPGLASLGRRLVEATDGNPFFLEESVRALVDSGALVGARGDYRPTELLHGLEVPATVQAMLAARIDRLPADAKELLETAAVIGKDVPFEILRAMAEVGDDALEPSLSVLEKGEFIYQTGAFREIAYTFKHALTHEVAYTTLLGDRRRALHARALATIEAQHPDRLDEHVEALAHHAIRAEARDRAVRYLRQSGARAFAQGAIAEAAERYQQALGHLHQLPGTVENARLAVDLCLDLHSPLVMLGLATRGLEIGQDAERLARQLDDRPRVGRLLHQIGYDLLFAARYEESMDYARRTLDIATELGQPPLGMQATRLLGLNHLARAEYPEAIRLLGAIVEHEAPARATPGALRRLVSYLETYGWLAFALAVTGDFGRAAACADRGVALAASAEHPLTRTLASSGQAYPLLLKGDFAAALPWCEEGGPLSRQTGFLAWVPGVYHMWGWALVGLGRLDEGLAHLREAADLHEKLEVRFQRSLVFFQWAEGLFLAGRTRDAEDTAQRALDLALAAGERYGVALARHLLAEIAATRAGALGAALRDLAEAEHLAREIGAAPLVARCRLSRGSLLAGAGRRADAAGELDAAAAMFTAMGMSFWLDRARTARDALGR